MVSVKRLKETELLCDLTTAELEAISQIFELRTYETGAIIFNEGDESTEIFIVDEGQAECVIEPIPNQPLVVDTMTRNQLFGWSAMVPPHHRTATIKATTKTRVLVAGASDLRRICQVHPHIYDEIMEKIVLTVDDRLGKTRKALVQTFYECQG